MHPPVLLQAETLNQLYLTALRHLSVGEYLQTSRNGATSECHPAVLQLTDVRYRSLTLPRRKKNLLLQLTEFLWIWNGSNRLRPLAQACPRWADYSDDGQTLHGAYGHRLRKPVDQIEGIIARMQAHPDDRQCVMAIWRPTDVAATSKDIPCNNWLHFLVRDDKLDLTVTVRSNDLWWGVPYNVFNWTQLQCVVAGRLGMLPGVYTHIADSLHLYLQHVDAYRAVVEETDNEGGGFASCLPVDGLTDDSLAWLWRITQSLLEEVTRERTADALSSICYANLPAYWKDYVLAIAVSAALKRPAGLSLTTIARWWEQMTTDLRIEVAEVFFRRGHGEFLQDWGGWLDQRTQEERHYVVGTAQQTVETT